MQKGSIIDMLSESSYERPHVENLLKYRKSILAGPQMSGRTSILFEIAFQYAANNQSVLFISPTKITRLPIMLNGRNQPYIDILNKIQMVYLTTKNEYLEFMASIHIKQKDPVRLMIVDDIDFYYKETEKHNELAVLAKVYAFLLDAAAFLDQLRSVSSSSFSQCSVVCSILTTKEENSKIPNNSILRRWFDDFLILKRGQNDTSFSIFVQEDKNDGKQEERTFVFVAEGLENNICAD